MSNNFFIVLYRVFLYGLSGIDILWLIVYNTFFITKEVLANIKDMENMVLQYP